MNSPRYVWKFRLFGVPVAVLPSFWFLCVAFSPFLSRIDPETPWIWGLLGWTAATTLAVLTHEFGHALAAKRLYGASPEIALGIGTAPDGTFVFGGVTVWRSFYSQKSSNWNQAFVALAGANSLFLGVVALLAVAFLCGCEFTVGIAAGAPIPLVFPTEWALGVDSNDPLAAFLGYFVFGFIWICIFWGAINLVPVYPLNGGQIATALCAQLSPKNGVRNALILSVVCAAGLAYFFFLHESVFAAFFFAYLTYQNYALLQNASRR